MGKHGNWKAENYKINHVDKSRSPHEHRFQVNATDASGTKVASADYNSVKDQGTFVANLKVKPKHQRKGIASAMHDHAEKHSNQKIVQEPEFQTADAKALWSARLNKTMMIGHGALGAPTSLVGGAALLSESVGRVRKVLKKKKKAGDIFKAIDEMEEVEQLSKGKFKELAIEAEELAKKAEAILAKMSRPQIGFPQFKKLSTRPDQEVQTIETGRQKDMFGRKVANAHHKDQKNVPYSEARTGSDGKLEIKDMGTKDYSKQPTRDASAKKISGSFDRNTLGMNVSNPKEKPKSAALAGKLRSKFEEGDEEHQAKLANHTEKRAGVVKDYNDKFRAWQKTGMELSNKVHEPGGHEAWTAHRATKPEKPTLPRRPAKKRVATEDLSPEKMKIRGNAIDSTIHHEGFHHTMAEMERHYGKTAAQKAHAGIVSQFHPDALKSVGGFIHEKMGYKPSSPKFTEEILAHSRDILTNPTKRASYKKYAGEKADEHIKNLKAGHEKAYRYARKLRPDDVGSEVKKSETLQNARSIVTDFKKSSSKSLQSNRPFGKTEIEKSEKRGLWANIRAKKERIKNGAKERMRSPKSSKSPTRQDFKDSQSKKTKK